VRQHNNIKPKNGQNLYSGAANRHQNSAGMLVANTGYLVHHYLIGLLMSSSKLNLVDFSQANIRLLHLTWFAFFLTFVVWFSHAPLKPVIMAAFDISNAQWKALLILNVAENGWRFAIASVGVVAFVYGIIFYWRARNTPKGSTYFKPKKSGGLEVSNKKDFYFYLLMNLPMYIILAVLAWKLSPAGVSLLSQTATYIIYVGLVLLCVFQFSQIYKVNKDMLNGATIPEHDRYKFKQVAVLDWAYFVTFGSELAVVSMLPGFFMETFDGLTMTTAAALGSAYAFMNLAARPGGGYISDKFGRRPAHTAT